MNLHCLRCENIAMGAHYNTNVANAKFVCKLSGDQCSFLNASPDVPECFREGSHVPQETPKGGGSDVYIGDGGNTTKEDKG